MSYDIWCKHFNGIFHAECRAGVKYADVEVPNTSPRLLPCFKDRGCTERCSQAVFYTPEEIAEKEREASEAIQQFLSNLENDICPHCEKPIQEKKQIGRCVYGYPCGHRLYQGTLPKKEAKQDTEQQMLW